MTAEDPRKSPDIANPAPAQALPWTRHKPAIDELMEQLEHTPAPPRRG